MDVFTKQTGVSSQSWPPGGVNAATGSEVLAQAAHECAPIGQGNANGRSDRSSTLA